MTVNIYEVDIKLSDARLHNNMYLPIFGGLIHLSSV